MLTYHKRYGYPWRSAILAEITWRMEHIRPTWATYDGRPLAPIHRLGYRLRKHAERRGAALSKGGSP